MATLFVSKPDEKTPGMSRDTDHANLFPVRREILIAADHIAFATVNMFILMGLMASPEQVASWPADASPLDIIGFVAGFSCVPGFSLGCGLYSIGLVRRLRNAALDLPDDL